MLRQLIDGLRSRAPLERGTFGMATLLREASTRWSAGERLISRPHAYTRTCAYRDECFEVLLLNWSPGAASAIHDHGDQHCWMAVLRGRLEVDDYARLDQGEVPGYARIEARGSRSLGVGGLDLRSGRFDLHRVAAAPSGDAVSLHVYAGPLRKFLVYDELSRRCETALGTYDDVLHAYSEALHR